MGRDFPGKLNQSHLLTDGFGAIWHALGNASPQRHSQFFQSCLGQGKDLTFGASLPWTPLIFLFNQQSKSQTHSPRQAMAGGSLSYRFAFVFLGAPPLIANHAGWTFRAKIQFSPLKRGVKTH